MDQTSSKKSNEECAIWILTLTNNCRPLYSTSFRFQVLLSLFPVPPRPCTRSRSRPFLLYLFLWTFLISTSSTPTLLQLAHQRPRILNQHRVLHSYFYRIQPYSSTQMAHQSTTPADQTMQSTDPNAGENASATSLARGKACLRCRKRKMVSLFA